MRHIAEVLNNYNIFEKWIKNNGMISTKDLNNKMMLNGKWIKLIRGRNI